MLNRMTFMLNLSNAQIHIEHIQFLWNKNLSHQRGLGSEIKLLSIFIHPHTDVWRSRKKGPHISTPHVYVHVQFIHVFMRNITHWTNVDF